jgi:carboxypeptidase family protein
MPTVCWRRVAGIVLVCAGTLAGLPPVLAQPANPQAAAISGLVLDRADGSPIADVSVRLQDSGTAVKTDEAGRFEPTGIAPGRRIVYVSLVGFILVKRPVEVAPGAALDLTIVLSEGTGTYTETASPASGSASRRSRCRRSRRWEAPRSRTCATC